MHVAVVVSHASDCSAVAVLSHLLQLSSLVCHDSYRDTELNISTKRKIVAGAVFGEGSVLPEEQTIFIAFHDFVTSLTS
jgi:hypothetical protein